MKPRGADPKKGGDDQFPGGNKDRRTKGLARILRGMNEHREKKHRVATVVIAAGGGK